MKSYRFLGMPRWLGLSAAGVVVMVVCALLSQWQWGRAEQRAEANARIEAAAEARPLDEVVPAGAGLDGSARWTLVEATGVYDASGEIVLRAQTNNSVNGFEIVTPLVLEDGTAILVNRGFVASEGTGRAPDYPAPPSGEVTVTGRVYESEPPGGAVGEDGGVLTARRLSLELLEDHIDHEPRDAWIADVEPVEGLQPLETPSFRSWQNYSYAAQWALFAALIPVGWVVLVRREMRGEPDEPVSVPGSSSTAA
ncbi:SURF1 family protein [Glycomyces sp. L485]|uniref:SURF1 family cytochrome oxidase biogenesis protein n=1 Tax=Glycomyces sp. L485 TaxID=2909235 RepID=UPI001F4AF986|nr:SURF1 family protein [Glycomyces sp. L485]MCH7231319.1 SURF1 family protein [Glycomyces sp. L485]